ncbi:DNA polymerase III subunit gamma/tau [Pasteurellaceae bacterium Pebbles2]|nr:DNA polymerase III subunit gamma/tau [Pasteurellaceae bacterium Pebbles2]
MSYQVLARKWRPKTFSEVVGQEHILTALSNGLKENRLHHAYLFSGTRGVGKTSIARLFAKGLNCVNGVTAEPCGECEHCKAIEEGSFIDLIEIDAASRTKVEDTRELLDNVQYKPVLGRYKVYLIDEVHMLSRHSFNALLKTLEEPPEYVKFLLATTDPQKLPVTILSRCMQFHLKALEPQQISHHLAYILEQENIPYESTALDKIAKAAQGSIRDSLSLTDQAIAMSNGNIRREIVSDMLGLLDDNQAIDIVYALQQANGEKLMQAVQAVAEKGADWDELLIEVGEVLHQIAMQQLLPNSSNDESPIAFLAKHISPEDVQFFYQTVITGRKELSLAPNRRMGAEMTLLRALAFHPKLMQQQAVSAQQSPVQAKSAVQNSADLMEMPVVSQNIKASYSAQHQIRHENSPQKPPQAEMQGHSTATQGSTALNALEQIEKLRSSLTQTGTPQADHEKKKSDLTSSTSEYSTSQTQAVELPVISTRPKLKAQTDLIERLANLPGATANAATNTSSTDKSAVQNNEDLSSEEDEDLNNAENYRWEWLNPDIDEQNTGIRPSDIKQAILQEKTPELTRKVIELAEQRDPWAKLVDELALDGLKLVKQVALNSVLLAQNEHQICLGLRSEQAHLLREKSIEVLTERLTQVLNQPVELKIELNDDKEKLTPLDHRRQIYQELSEQARQDLQEDNCLKLLQKNFDAKLDMDSIRPV